MRKILVAAAVVSISALAAPTVFAAKSFGPMKCIANIGKLDTNDDGFVDNKERGAYSKVMVNVDVDKDGKISPDEAVVACKDLGFRDSFRSSE